MSDLGVEVVPYLIGWAILIFIIGSTWHIWMYLGGEDDSHRQVHAKVLTLGFCSGLGLLFGGFLFFFLQLLNWGLETFADVNLIGMVSVGGHANKILLAACVQASTGMLLLNKTLVNPLLKVEEVNTDD